MKKHDKKIKEPYEPDNTPKPPQIIDPNREKNRENPIEDKERKTSGPDNKALDDQGKSHLLSEDADIDDETTI